MSTPELSTARCASKFATTASAAPTSNTAAASPVWRRGLPRWRAVYGWPVRSAGPPPCWRNYLCRREPGQLRSRRPHDKISPMRIVIVEDSVLLREGIVRLLSESGHDVVAQLVDATALMATVLEQQPDLVVLDVRLPPTFTDEGIQAAVAVRAEIATQPILVLS